jgi:hypothetical protein
MITGLSLGAGNRRNSTPIPPLIAHCPSSVDCTYPINKMIKLTKQAIELLDAVTSVPYSRKGLRYIYGVVWMPSCLSPATPTGSPATLTREDN